MQGKRIADNKLPKRPGGYSKQLLSGGPALWRVMTPSKVLGFISDVIEHGDGTISSRRSIVIQNSSPVRWIGQIDHGKWIERAREGFSKMGMRPRSAS